MFLISLNGGGEQQSLLDSVENLLRIIEYQFVLHVSVRGRLVAARLYAIRFASPHYYLPLLLLLLRLF